MKHTHSSLHSIRTQFLVLSLGIAVASISPSAHAANTTWNGNTDNKFSTTANWTSVTPHNNSPFFGVAGSSGTTLNNDIVGGSYFDLIFNSGASAYIINGNSFTLPSNRGIANNSTNLQTINTDIALANSDHSFNATSGDITLGGNLSGTTGSLIFTGAGTTTLGGTNTFTTTGANFKAFIVGGSGATVGNVSITGATTVDGTGFSDSRGYLDVHGNSTLTIQTGGSFSLNTSTGTPSSIIGQDRTGTSTVLVNGGSFTIGGNSGFALGNNRNDATGVLTISSGTATITAGSATLQDARNFVAMGRDSGNGIINLNGGTLATGRQFVLDGSSGTGAGGFTGPGTANFNFNGGTLQAQANQTSGNGWFETATSGNFQVVTTTVKSGGAIIDTNGFNTNVNTVLAHDSGLGGTADGGLTKSGSGTLSLGGANTYTGATAVNAGTLKAGVASVANTSGAFGNNSAVTMANVSGATLDITGFNTQIGSLAGGGATGGNVTLGAATLTTGGADKSGSYAGVISGTSGSLTKIGTGTQTLTGSNIYTGATTISGGILQIGNGGTSGSISGTSGVTDNATLTYNRSDSLNVAYSISGSGNVKQIGTGTTTVTGTNSYSGTTTISSGTWKVNGLHTSAGAYTVQNGGTLGGSGTITTASNAGITLDAGGKLSPGNSPGTLTANLGSGVFDISAGVSATNSQSLLFDLTTTAASDRVLLSNALSTFNIGTGLEFDDFVFSTGAGFGPGIYTLLDGSNASGITGTLGTNLSGMLAGYNAVISFGNGGLVSGLSSTEDIILTVTAVPEPATYGALAGLALTGLSLTSVIRRRGKGMRA